MEKPDQSPSETVDLLRYSRGGGCGCKIGPSNLSRVLSSLDSGENSLLIGLAERDDAAVMELQGGDCLIQTADFFLPVVSDPFDFGRIAAANALSDVYAMGGRPVMAVSLLGWPVDKIAPDVAGLVLKGAEQICLEAGITISGGHSIETLEPLFGLSVNGIVSKKNLKRKNGCKNGDYLYLTKSLGLGLLSNALKHGRLDEKGYKNLIDLSTQLNVAGMILGQISEVNAMTDVTGFGLLGHLAEMLGDRFGAVLIRNQIPVIEEARNIAQSMMYPNITTSNYNFVSARCEGMEGLEFLWLCDPQTSGGLLISSSVPLEMQGIYHIGSITEDGRIRIE